MMFSESSHWEILLCDPCEALFKEWLRHMVPMSDFRGRPRGRTPIEAMGLIWGAEIRPRWPKPKKKMTNNPAQSLATPSGLSGPPSRTKLAMVAAQ